MKMINNGTWQYVFAMITFSMPKREYKGISITTELPCAKINKNPQNLFATLMLEMYNNFCCTLFA